MTFFPSGVSDTKMNAKAVKTIKKVERPRPLRTSVTEYKPETKTEVFVSKKALTDVIPLLEDLYVNICKNNFDEKIADYVFQICTILKNYGQEIDTTRKNMLDHYFVTLRNISREDRLDAISRLRLLEIIELKAKGWQRNENITNYYCRKIAELEGTTEQTPNALSTSHSSSSLLSPHSLSEQPPSIGVPLAPGEIIRSSGKFMNPTKIAGKNYYKDEVVIRNSDSGKVMGIKGRRVHMIEELSDTIISFQRVNPGARDRCVQIAGPNEESISYAKTLVEDTIRRNASPVRGPDANSNINIKDCTISTNSNQEERDYSLSNMLTHSLSMGDATAGEFVFTIDVSGHSLKVSCRDWETLQAAENLLRNGFYGQQAPVRQPMNLDNAIKQELKGPRNNLQRSSSWMGSLGSRMSVSPLDSSSEDDAFRESDPRVQSVPSEENTSAFTFEISDDDNVPTIPPPAPLRRIYQRDFLLRCRKSPLSNADPQLSPEIVAIYPMIVRDNSLQYRRSSSQESDVKPDDYSTS